MASIIPDSKCSSNSSNCWLMFASVQVRPAHTQDVELDPPPIPRVKPLELAAALYHWATCLFIIALVCSQLLGAIWDSETTTTHLIYGRSPLDGPSQIIGTNDVPYPDRVIACVRKGNAYEPRLVSSLLAASGSSSILEDSTGAAVHGYRLRQRRVGSVNDALEPSTKLVYTSSCELISKTIGNIFAACTALGYSNLTRDHLRVVDNWDSANLYSLPDTLPVLIMPYWDNANFARHAIPTWGGDACIFRLEDAYSIVDSGSTIASFRGVNQSVRRERTINWLQRPRGVWRNGWYEDPEGMRWYSDVTSAAAGAPYYMNYRLFDMRTGHEIDCSDPDKCIVATVSENWGQKFIVSDKLHDMNSVYIANGSEFGFFLYETHERHTVRIVFDWETLVASLSVALVLVRWLVSIASLHLGAIRSKRPWLGGGIGCVASAGSFLMLPCVSLPRLKFTLTALWTVGCMFEGQQSGLSESWFVIYPEIARFVLIYFSLLNWAAKALRCRMQDVLFAPTVVALCLLHYFRVEIARSGWIKGLDGRINTVVFSNEIDKLHLVDYFTTDIAWRIDGRVPFIFGVKLAIIGINLIPLLLARSFPVECRSATLDLKGVEKALGLRAKQVGGLGKSLPYLVAVVDKQNRLVSSARSTTTLIPGGSNVNDSIENDNATKVAPDREDSLNEIKSDQQASPPREVVLVDSSEIIRLGYLVYGDKYLITFDEWDLLSAMAPFRAFCHLWNHRVLVWTLRDAVAGGDAEIVGGRALQSTEPEMWRLDDHRLQAVKWWQVSACSIEC